jgi:dTDP-4-amino-4,6-dideoxygalactose transaminase
MDDSEIAAGSKAAELESYLPFSAPCFGPEEREEVTAALESDWITTGPRTRRFEQEFAGMVGSKHAIAVNSCTAALHLSLLALNIEPGDVVVTSPFTFCATANVVVHCGAVPVFVDIRPDTYTLDPNRLREFFERDCEWNGSALNLRRTGGRVRAITTVHYAGQPCDMDEINELAERYALAVIEDAAHAAGAVYKGRKVGTLGNVSCFSFYANKNMTTAEGGMLTTNDDDLAGRARLMSLHGISRDAWKRYTQEGTWRYDVEHPGYKYNLTDIASAIGLHQLRKLPGFIAKRRLIATGYLAGLDGLPLILPESLPDRQHAWHLFPVQVTSSRVSRDEAIASLSLRRIGTSVHFIPLHLTSYYQRAFGYGHGDFPVTEQVFDRIVSLPLFPRMTDQDVQRVIDALHQVLS